MLAAVGLTHIDDLFRVIPRQLRLPHPLRLPEALPEWEAEAALSKMAASNLAAGDAVCFLGGGVYDHFVPRVIAHLVGRGELATSYTPYQPELNQGFLQAAFEYQSMICRLTGMDVSNSSLYDASTGLAEAYFACAAVQKRTGPALVASSLNPLYRQVLTTYLAHSGPLLEIPYDPNTGQTAYTRAPHGDRPVCVMVQQPNFLGCIEDLAAAREFATENEAMLVVCADPIALGLLKPPGEFGADIVVGEGQSSGLEMSLGGPLLGIFASRREYIRQMPGRIVGRARDSQGKEGFVLTLQVREQHIRREKATSNICTNQALCALAASIYLAALGETGLRQVAEQCLARAHYAQEQIASLPGFSPAFPGAVFFKEFAFRCPKPPAAIVAAGKERHILPGLPLGRWYPELEDALLVCVTEKRSRQEIDALVQLLGEARR